MSDFDGPQPPTPYPMSDTINQRLADLEQYAWRTVQELQARVDYLEAQLGLSAFPKAVQAQQAVPGRNARGVYLA